MEIRNWQQKIIDDFPSIVKDNRRFILKAPTGAGKTFLASELIKRFYNRKKVIVLCHRLVLLEQLEKALQKEHKIRKLAVSETSIAFDGYDILLSTNMRAKEIIAERIPEWKDNKVAEMDKRNIVTFAKRYGFNEQELNNATDHRAILMLRKAMLYDELESKKPLVKKKVKKAPKMTKSGKKITTTKTLQKGKVDKAFNKLKSTGSMDSAVDYLLQKSN